MKTLSLGVEKFSSSLDLRSNSRRPVRGIDQFEQFLSSELELNLSNRNSNKILRSFLIHNLLFSKILRSSRESVGILENRWNYKELAEVPGVARES